MPKLSDDIRQQVSDLLSEQIPLCQAMGLELKHLSLAHVRLSMPLDVNVNDKGTAFGGSIAAALTLAGWSLLTTRLLHEGLDADLMIHRSDIIYERPVNTDFHAYCDWLDEEDWQTFLNQLRRRGRARLVMKSWVAGDQHAAATMTGSFVAIMRS